MNRIERFSLFLAAAGSALAWLVPSLMLRTELPEWVGSRFYLYICGPAILLGTWSFHRYGGYAKSWTLLFCAALTCVGILWTDSTEQGRGMLLASAFLVTLPIASLIRKQNYLQQFLTSFALVTALAMLYGLTQPAALGRWGEIVDNAGTHITNANVVGTQAAAGIMAVFMSFSRRGRWNRILFAAALLVLVAVCLRTETRTGVLALAGAGFAVIVMRLRRKPALLFTAAFATLVLFACLLAFDAAISDGSVSRSVVNRLVLDDEENLGSLGSRTSIWRFAGQEFFEGTTWLTGVGTGGVDKALGKFYEFTGRVAGRDRIWRLYPHNSLVQNALAYGIFGLLLAFCLAVQVGRKAYLLDSRFGGWQRTAFAVFLGLVGTGGVVEREVYWIALGSALWAMISSDNLPSQARAAASRVWRTHAGQMRASQSSHASPGFN